MTDHDPSARDELIAAFLDGEATADERALIQSDPALLARAEELGRVASLVAAAVPKPDPEVREAHIAAALEASSTSPVVRSLGTAPRRRFAERLPTLAAAAAAVLIAAVAIPVLLSDDDGDDTAATAISDEIVSGDDAVSGGSVSDDERSSVASAESAAADLDEASDAADGGVQGDAASDAADGSGADPTENDAGDDAASDAADDGPRPDPSMTALVSDPLASAVALDVGAVATIDDLFAAIDATDGSVSPADAGARERLACTEALAGAVGAATADRFGTAVVDGVPVEFVRIELADGTRRLLTVAADDCAPAGMLAQD